MSFLPNVLAQRYATPEMREIWSPEGRVKLERDLWIAVLKAQREIGLDIPAEAITAYERVKDIVDLDAIRERERTTLHDVKARIEVFCELAGHEQIHKGMTSRDLTENIEQLQLFLSLKLLRVKIVAALQGLSSRAQQYKGLMITGRSHNVAAQPTTLGKRLAMFGEEILLGLESLDHFLETYPVRGIKGAVGTQLDQWTLFKGDSGKVDELEKRIGRHLGLPRVLDCTGQVYPRSLDHAAVGTLVQSGSGAAGFAHTLRLMAGQELASEGFLPGQVGSSAMPHKMNSRSCERINGFLYILKGFHNMLASLAGDQWNEGDVSCSVVRRVALPDACFAADGLWETFLTIMGQMEVYESRIREENNHYLPFLATTTLLMKAVERGAGREEAHDCIKEHAVAAARALRHGEISKNNLLEKLDQDWRFPLSQAEMQQILDNPDNFIGNAVSQVGLFVRRVAEWGSRFPEAAGYKPHPIL